MKFKKLCILVFGALFIISMIVIWYAAGTTISSGMDRPQWEENLTELDYFLIWCGISLFLNVILCLLTLGVYTIIKRTLRHSRHAFVNRGLDRKASIANSYSGLRHLCRQRTGLPLGGSPRV